MSKLAMNRARVGAIAAFACFAMDGCSPDFGLLNVNGGAGGSSGRAAGGRASGGSSVGGLAATGDQAGMDSSDDMGGMSGVGGDETTVATGGSPAVSGAGSSAKGGAASGVMGGTGGKVSSGGQGGAGSPGSAGVAFGGGGGAPPLPGCSGAGKAVLFGPNVYVTLPRPIQDDFTIEAWIATTAARVGQYFYQGNPVVWADETGDLADFGMSVLNGKLVMNIGMPETQLTSTSTVATGQWVHVATTRERATGIVKLYVNGELEGTVVANTASLVAQAILSVGSSELKAAALEGRMDDLKLWAVVRTQAEIQAGMHEPPKQEEPGLVGFYRFDDIVTTVVRDSSPRRNNGTITSTAAAVVSDAPICDAPAGQGGSSGNAGDSAGSSGTVGGSGTSAGAGGASGDSAGNPGASGGSSGTSGGSGDSAGNPGASAGSSGTSAGSAGTSAGTTGASAVTVGNANTSK